MDPEAIAWIDLSFNELTKVDDVRITPTLFLSDPRYTDESLVECIIACVTHI